MTRMGSHRALGPSAASMVGRLTATTLIALLLAVAAGPSASAQPAPVGFGTAGSFAVLAGSTVTNTGPSVVNGDLGVSPGNAVTGFPPGVVNGTIHAGDATAANAQSDSPPPTTMQRAEPATWCSPVRIWAG